MRMTFGDAVVFTVVGLVALVILGALITAAITYPIFGLAMAGLVVVVLTIATVVYKVANR